MGQRQLEEEEMAAGVAVPARSDVSAASAGRNPFLKKEKSPVILGTVCIFTVQIFI